MVASGQIDIAAASMTHKVARDDTIDFTISYFFDGQSILARKGCKKRSAKGFAGKKVGAIQGATSGANFKKAVPKAKIVYFQEYPQAVMALHKKKIDAITTDLVWCSTQAKDSHGKLKVVGGTISFEPYGMGIPENESNFRDAVNFAIQKAVKDGTYAKLYRKWFGENPKQLPEVWP
jgi:polar amino acid transport system substrate-binding protein